MAIYSISKEGVAAFEQLAKDLTKLNSDIEACGTTLTTTVTALGENLGVFEEKIIELIYKINNTQEKGRESIELLVQKVSHKANDINELLNQGLA